MKKNQKGFGLIEGLLVVVILGIIGLVGWYIVHQKNNSKNSSNSNANSAETNPPEFKYSEVEVPQDWGKYDNKQYGIRFSYPNTMEVNESELDASQGADKAEFVAQAVMKSAQGGGGGYEVRILNMTLSEAVKFYKDGIEESEKTELLGTDSVSKNGFTGVKITSKYTQQDPDTTVVTAGFLFDVRNKVYQFYSVYEEDTLNPTNVEESKRIFNSLELK